MGKKIQYLFEHCEVINYTLDGVSIHPITTKTQVSFPTQRKETSQGFHHEANGDFNLSWVGGSIFTSG
jgi:hypothetical protein